LAKPSTTPDRLARISRPIGPRSIRPLACQLQVGPGVADRQQAIRSCSVPFARRDQAVPPPHSTAKISWLKYTTLPNMCYAVGSTPRSTKGPFPVGVRTVNDVLIEPDDRGRVSLSKIPGANAERYLARRLSDGSVILQPAVLMSQQALDSLAALAKAKRSDAPPGRPLRDILDRVDRPAPTAAVIEQTMQQLDERRARGARFLSDITDDERREMHRHQASQPDSDG
jgi:hypothetical protein